MSLDDQIKAARERLHRSIGQKARRALEAMGLGRVRKPYSRSSAELATYGRPKA